VVAHDTGFDPPEAEHVLDDVVIVTSTPDSASRAAEHPAVVTALRYLLNRYELATNMPAPQIIAVVSATGGEGVTTVSRSLAGLLSTETRSNVCWVDLGELDSTGMPTAIGGQREESRHDLEEPKSLHVGSAHGATPGASVYQHRSNTHLDSASLYAAYDRPEFASALRDLSSRYRHVIFDTPPLLSEPDSLGFMRHADAYIVVCRHGRTTKNQVKRLNQELSTIPSLGAILNGYRTRTPRLIRQLFSE